MSDAKLAQILSKPISYDSYRNKDSENCTGWSKKNKTKKPLLAAILKYLLEVINVCVYIFGKFRRFYASGEEIVEKDARMSLLRLFEHI